MRDEKEIKSNLERTYRYRLELRIKRMMRRCCRNCVSGREEVISAGDLGEIRRWVCSEGCKLRGESCASFTCRNTPDSIAAGMLRDIGDPSVCGAKEPRIAALMWTLQSPGQACGGMSVPEARFLDRIVAPDENGPAQEAPPASTERAAPAESSPEASPEESGEDGAGGSGRGRKAHVKKDSDYVYVGCKDPDEGCTGMSEGDVTGCAGAGGGGPSGGPGAEDAAGVLSGYGPEPRMWPFLDSSLSWVRGKSLRMAGRVMMFLAGVPW